MLFHVVLFHEYDVILCSLLDPYESYLLERVLKSDRGIRIQRPLAENDRYYRYLLSIGKMIFFLQLRRDPTDLLVVVPRNDAIFPKLQSTEISCYFTTSSSL